MNRAGFLTLLCATTLLLAHTAHAQRLVGTVSHATTGAAVPGALVSAYTDKGDTVALTLSSSVGRFALTIPAGRTFTLLVRSIGLRALRVPIGPLAAAQDSVVQIRMEPIVWTLATVRVGAVTLCDRNLVGTDGVAQIWTEVTNALESSRQTSRILKREYDWTLYSSEMNARTGDLSGSERKGSSLATRPFHAATAKELANNGYVIPERTSMLFKAPDEAVLQDERFVEGHCFWASSLEKDGVKMIELHFIPVDALRVNDIAGTFLIDARTYELKNLKFHYTRIAGGDARRIRAELAARGAEPPAPVATDGLNGAVDPFKTIPGGELRFKRLDDGTMIIDKWQLWVTDNWLRSDPNGRPLPMPRVIREAGGEVVRIGGGSGPSFVIPAKAGIHVTGSCAP